MDPLVGEHDPVGSQDLVAERNRPAMLDQRDRGAGAVRDRVGEVPDVALVDEVTVGHLRGSGCHRALEVLLACADADERADESPELLGLVRAEVARLDGLELPVALRDEHQIDQTDDLGVLEPLDLGHDRAVEVGPVEPEDEHLHRAERDARSLGAAHDTPARTFAFWTSNSASVRIPCSLSLASSSSCSTMSPWLGCGAACTCCAS